jgi:DegV family protein with EDD domain
MGEQLVQVVTDSTSDIPPEVARAAGIEVVPLTIRFGREVFADGVQLSGEAFYERLRTCVELPTTSAPSPGDFLEVYRRAVAAGRQVLSIHISALVSATYSSAVLAAQEFPGQVHVVDSRNVSMAVGWVALRAAAAARTGASIEAVREMVEDLLPRAHLYAVLGTLENLRRGGRLGRAAAFLGTVLQVKPVLTIHNGEVSPVEKVRLINRALERLVDIAKDHAPIEHLAVAQTDAPGTIEQLRQLLAERMPELEFISYRAGAIIGALAGPGAVALVFVSGRKG